MQLYGVATRAQSVPKGWHVDAWQRRRGECTEYGGFVRIGEFTLCNVVLMVHALQTVSDHGASNSFYSFMITIQVLIFLYIISIS